MLTPLSLTLASWRFLPLETMTLPAVNGAIAGRDLAQVGHPVHRPAVGELGGHQVLRRPVRPVRIDAQDINDVDLAFDAQRPLRSSRSYSARGR